MNYFTHGRHYAHDPYFLAGTAVPDWLSMGDRRVRARERLALPWVEDDNPNIAALARGIMQHHHDDQWFHQTRAFAEISMQFTLTIRDTLPPDNSLRPSFLGHILVELLLDAELIAEGPHRLDAYYQAMESLDPQIVESAVNRMTTRQTEIIAPLIPRFCSARFLYDYSDDDKLLMRLNQVMKRVKLSQLPDSLCQILPAAREAVRQRKAELLQGENTNATTTNN